MQTGITGFPGLPNSREEHHSCEFCVPQPMAVLDLTLSDGATLRVRRHGNPGGPRLILSHGNGFAIDAYFPFWCHFLHDCEVIVFDQRNHGWNARHDARGHTEWQMAQDMETILRAVADEFGERRAVGAFHSLSTIVSLLHSMQYGFSWDTLILFDPPLAPPPGHPQHSLARNFELALHDWARQRRSRFRRRRRARHVFQERPPPAALGAGGRRVDGTRDHQASGQWRS